jgi:DNA-binding transcriptional regulator YiaG
MLFAEQIRQLREKKLMPQRKFAVGLEIDSAMYSKMECGDCCAKRGWSAIIAQLLQTDEKKIVTLGLTDNIIAVVAMKKG